MVHGRTYVRKHFHQYSANFTRTWCGLIGDQRTFIIGASWISSEIETCG